MVLAVLVYIWQPEWLPEELGPLESSVPDVLRPAEAQFPELFHPSLSPASDLSLRIHALAVQDDDCEIIFQIVNRSSKAIEIPLRRRPFFALLWPAEGDPAVAFADRYSIQQLKNYERKNYLRKIYPTLPTTTPELLCEKMVFPGFGHQWDRRPAYFQLAMLFPETGTVFSHPVYIHDTFVGLAKSELSYTDIFERP